MGEENWPENVVRSKGLWDFLAPSMLRQILHPLRPLGKVIVDGPRAVICADCGSPTNGVVLHVKPEIYAIRYEEQIFYLERHVGIDCGCAAKRGFV